MAGLVLLQKAVAVRNGSSRSAMGVWCGVVVGTGLTACDSVSNGLFLGIRYTRDARAAGMGGSGVRS